jgi:hypothetical protein
MIEENKNNNNEIFDALPIPEDAVILKPKKVLDLSQLALLGIKEMIRQRGINLKVKKKRDVTELDCILEINNFYIQVIFAGFSSDQIIVPLERWYKINNAPQIILAANIDEESNIVSFQGIITAKEFINIYLKKNAKGQSFEIPLSEFKGGINRLLSFVQILDSKALSRSGLTSKLNSQNSLLKKIGFSRRNISIAALIIGSVIFGPNIFRPKLSYDLASISLSQIEVSSKTRSSLKKSNKSNVCLLSPFISPKDNNQFIVSNISFDKPIIYSPYPLNEIIISKNDKELWRAKGQSISERIEGIIEWPTSPLKPNQKYLITITPIGVEPGVGAKINLHTSPKESFIQLDPLINSLGKNKTKWINIIDKNLKQDKNLAFALLFSKKMPNARVLIEAKNKLISLEGCNQ